MKESKYSRIFWSCSLNVRSTFLMIQEGASCIHNKDIFILPKEICCQ